MAHSRVSPEMPMWQVRLMMTLPSIRRKQCAVAAYFASVGSSAESILGFGLTSKHCSAASVGLAVSRAAKMIALFLMCLVPHDDVERWRDASASRNRRGMGHRREATPSNSSSLVALHSGLE